MQQPLTPQQIMRKCNDYQEFTLMDDKQKYILDMLEIELNGLKNMQELHLYLTSELMLLHFYLIYFEKQEEYEVCAKILDTIPHIINNVRRMGYAYFIPQQIDIDTWNIINNTIKKKIRDDYDYYHSLYIQEQDNEDSILDFLCDGDEE